MLKTDYIRSIKHHTSTRSLHFSAQANTFGCRERVTFTLVICQHLPGTSRSTQGLSRWLPTPAFQVLSSCVPAQCREHFSQEPSIPFTHGMSSRAACQARRNHGFHAWVGAAAAPRAGARRCAVSLGSGCFMSLHSNLGAAT